MRQQRLADAVAALRWADEQVFQVNSGTAAEGREVDEPDCKAGGLTIPFRDFAEQPRLFAEQRRAEVSFGGLDFVRQLFVFGEFANQRQHQSGFIGTRAADGEGHAVAHLTMLIPRPQP